MQPGRSWDLNFIGHLFTKGGEVVKARADEEKFFKCVSVSMCGGQKKALWSQFFPANLWDLEIKFSFPQGSDMGEPSLE